MNISLLGRKIISIRLMTPKEQKIDGRNEPATVLVLDNGIRIYPSCDEEGNAPGTLFGLNKKNESFYVFEKKEA